MFHRGSLPTLRLVILRTGAISFSSPQTSVLFLTPLFKVIHKYLTVKSVREQPNTNGQKTPVYLLYVES